MIMSLIGMIENSTKSNVKKQKDPNAVDKNNKTDKDEKSDTKKSDKDCRTTRDAKIANWKKEAPKAGESLTKVFDGRTYYWCKACCGGEGMWAIYQTHDPNFNKNVNASKGVSN